MSLVTKTKKAVDLGIDLKKIEETNGSPLTEEQIDELIEQKIKANAQEKQEEKIQAAAEQKADEDAKKKQLVLKDVDGADVDQAEYFFPRLEEETINGKIHKPSTKTAPHYFNKLCGYPVEREDLIDVFTQFFPRRKGFLFYRQADREVYQVIVPLKYATTVSRSNESRPGDFQRHAFSFIQEGSVNVDSLKLKLSRIAKHTSISTEPLA
jgi:hypothetical protein